METVTDLDVNISFKYFLFTLHRNKSLDKEL